ncbi:MAG: type IV pilus assembly protein PilM [Bacillota bacterium]|nr:type IV pilus assembly protein PilM [Bacillota bacterium]
MVLGTEKRAIGLEIDSGKARAVELTGKQNTYKLDGLGSIELPPEAVKEGMIQQPRIVGNALKELWSGAGLKENQVVLGISNQGVLVRHITVPKVSDDKLGNVIRFQAQEYLPIPLEGVVLDYLVLGETAKTEEGMAQLEIMLVGARRDMLDKFLEALEVAGLEPLDIDVSSMAQINLLPPRALQMTVAIVNVANGLSSIVISVHGKPRLARLGMVKIMDLAESLECPVEDILLPHILKQEGAADKLRQWGGNLAGEIRSSLTYFQDQHSNYRVEGVLLSGRGARFGGLAAKLEEYLALPVRIFNPLEKFSPARRRLLDSDFEAAEYAVSAGLALRGLGG